MVGIDGPDLMFRTPAKLTLPNSAGAAPGSVSNLMTMDMATGGFDVSGQLQVTPDGRSLVTIDGGVNNSSCGFITVRPPGDTVPILPCGCPTTGNSLAGSPSPVTGGSPQTLQMVPVTPVTAPAPGPPQAFASDASVETGEYYQDHALVPYQSLGQSKLIWP
jgi:hypothetical protein